MNKFLKRLVEPSPAIRKADKRRQARLLSGILLPLLVMFPLGSYSSTLPNEQLLVGIVAIATWIAYALSRTKYYLFAGVFEVIVLFIPSYILLLSEPVYTHSIVLAWTSWMSLPLILGSIWLPLLIMTIIWLVNICSLLLVPVLLRPDLGYELLIIGILQQLVFGSMILTAAYIHSKDQKKLLQQSSDMEIAKKQAESSNQAKTRFLASMSHELRTPLHGILSYAQFGHDKMGTISDQRLKKYFSQIKASGERLKVLLDDLLDLSKLEAGKMVMDLSLQDLKPIIESCVAEQQALLTTCKVSVEIDITDSIPPIQCDKNRIGQVVMNILSNAIKFSPEYGVITIHVKLDEMLEDKGELIKMIEFGVQDQGPGVPPGEEEKVFEKFTQSSLSNFSTGGTGLGLAISQELVQAHRGRMWYEHVAGGGALFKFTLPIQQTVPSAGRLN